MAQLCHFQTIRSFLKTSKLYFENNNLKIMANFSIASPSFNGGEEIPKKFGYKFENKNPEIDFENVPKDAKSLALIMDDPDAMGAVGKVWVHWLVCNWNPTKLDIDEGFRRETYKILMTKKDFGLAEGKTDFGEIGYGGPAPPDKRHTYIFKAYALDTTLDLEEGYSKQELEDAMKGHIIAEAKLTGTYAP